MNSLKNLNFMIILQVFAGLMSVAMITVISVLSIGGFNNGYVYAFISLVFIVVGGYNLEKTKAVYLESLFLGLLIVGEFVFIYSVSFEILHLMHSDISYYMMFYVVVFSISYYLVKSHIHRLVALAVIYYCLYILSLLFGVLPIYNMLLIIFMFYLLVKDIPKLSELKYILLIAILFMPLKGYAVDSYLVKQYSKNSLFLGYEYILYALSIIISFIVILRGFNFKIKDQTTWLLFVAVSIILYFDPSHIMLPFLVIVIGFYKNSLLIKAIAIISFVYRVVSYNYYNKITFLDKSKELAIFGIVLLLIALALNIYKKRLQDV